MNKAPRKLADMSKKELIQYIDELHEWYANFMKTADQQLADCLRNTKEAIKDKDSADWWKKSSQ